VNARKRTADEHLVLSLPTRSVRVTRGRTVWYVEMGSGRVSQVALTLTDEEEWRQIMEARESVRL